MEQKVHSVKAGSLLLAEPFMIDPNFKRSVVLMCEHTEGEGSVGFILNKPLDLKLTELVSDFPEFESTVYFGGPVATDTIHYVHCKGDIVDESIPVDRGIFWGGNFEKLKFLIESELILPKDIRFFVGYSGWDGGQLLSELESGSWVVSQGDPNYVFKSSSQKLWSTVMSNIGKQFSVIAQLPDDQVWN